MKDQEDEKINIMILIGNFDQIEITAIFLLMKLF